MKVTIGYLLFSFALYSTCCAPLAVAMENTSADTLTKTRLRKSPLPLKKLVEFFPSDKETVSEKLKYDEDREMFFFGKKLDDSTVVDDSDGSEEKLLGATDSANAVVKNKKLKSKKSAGDHGIVPEDKDERTRVVDVRQDPYFFHGQLVMDFGGGSRYIGSGTLIDERVVLTAAHNLYDRKTKRKAVLVTFFAGKDDGNSVGIGKSEAIKYPNEWSSEESSGMNYRDHDLGVVILTKDFDLVYSRIGTYLAISPSTDEDINGKVLKIFGYPGAVLDKNDPNSNSNSKNSRVNRVGGRFMYGHSGKSLNTTTSTQVHHNIDTSAGQSGSSIWYDDVDGNHICFAVHVRCGPKGKPYNIGTRITDEKYEMILGWLPERVINNEEKADEKK